MFSSASFRSISLATVTPSLVIVGEPNFFSRMTLRPFGPRVTFTALARLLTPRRIPCREESPYTICLAMGCSLLYLLRGLIRPGLLSQWGGPYVGTPGVSVCGWRKTACAIRDSRFPRRAEEAGRRLEAEVQSDVYLPGPAYGRRLSEERRGQRSAVARVVGPVGE